MLGFYPDRNLFFIDKTLLIRDLIDDGADILLFTRPRRFGKTFNMSTISMCVALRDTHYIKSNLEGGDGRSDIICIPKEKKFNPIIMEFKASLDKKEIIDEEKLRSLAEKAIENKFIIFNSFNSTNI